MAAALPLLATPLRVGDPGDYVLDLAAGRRGAPSSPSSLLIAGTSGGSVVALDLAAGGAARVLGKHGGGVPAVLVDADDGSVITCSLDGTVGVWDGRASGAGGPAAR